MNTNQLYISGRKVTIGAGQVVALTKQINSIGEIQSRQANLSNNFRVDYFEDNENHLNFAGRPGVQSMYPYRFLPARYVQNGFEIVRNANAVIKSAGDKSAQVTLYWGNNDFFDRLNFKLSELDLTELDHLFTLASVAALDNNIVYPFIEFGHNSLYSHITNLGVNINVQDLLKSYPAVKTAYLLQKISEHIGMTFEGDILNSVGIKSEALILTTRKSEIDNKEAIFVKSEWNDFSPGTGAGTFGYFKHQNIIQYGLLGSFPESVGPGSINFKTAFRNKTGKKVLMKFRVVLNAKWTKGQEQDIFRFRIILGDNTIPVEIQEVEEFDTPRVYEFEVDLRAEEYFKIFFAASTTGLVQLFPGSTFEMLDVTIPELGIGDTYTVAFNMPDITAFEFVKLVAQKYGVFFETENRNVKWLTFDDILKSKGELNTLPVDLIPGSRETDFNPGSYFQQNRIEYKQGNALQLFSSFEIDNKTLPEVGTILSFDSYLGSYIDKTGVDRCVQVSLFNENLDRQDLKLPFVYIQPRETLTVESGVVNPVYYGFSEGNINEGLFPLLLVNIAQFAILETTSSRSGITETMGLTPNLIASVNYGSLQKILNRFERHVFSAYMNEVQFNEIVNRKAYYIKELKSFVYIEAISNFVPNRPTKISMIKI
jgi:hypothetical protein